MKLNHVVAVLGLLVVSSLTFLSGDSGFTKIVNASDLESELKKSDYAIVKFTWHRCPPCKRMEPIDQEIAASYVKVKVPKNRIKKFFSKLFKKKKQAKKLTLRPDFFKVDIEEHEDLQDVYKVQSVPTYIFLKNGKEVSRSLGAKTKEKFEEEIKAFLQN